MEDSVYRGRRLRPQSFPLPDGGFGSKVLIFAGLSADGWTQLHIGIGRSGTREEALSLAIDVGKCVIDRQR